MQIEKRKKNFNEDLS